MQGSTQQTIVMDEDPLTQEPCELREEEVDITKNVMVLDEEELEEEEEGIGEKTLHDIAEEEEKDIYDPAILGKILIHCHFFIYSLIYPSLSFIHPSILPSIQPFIHSSFLLFIYLFIHLSIVFLSFVCQLIFFNY